MDTNSERGQDNNNTANMQELREENLNLVAENTSLVCILEEKTKLCQELREENLKLKGRLWEVGVSVIV
jgi:hypothetical protein